MVVAVAAAMELIPVQFKEELAALEEEEEVVVLEILEALAGMAAAVVALEILEATVALAVAVALEELLQEQLVLVVALQLQAQEVAARQWAALAMYAQQLHSKLPTRNY